MKTGVSVNSPVLTGWKQIATYLNMGLRTVQRYEREQGLPIRRPGGGPKGAVMATMSELDEWLVARPKKPLTGASQKPALIADSTWAALHAGVARMVQLKREMRQYRAEMRTALGILHQSIRVVDTASFKLLTTVQVGNTSAKKAMKHTQAPERKQPAAG